MKCDRMDSLGFSSLRPEFLKKRVVIILMVVALCSCNTAELIGKFTIYGKVQLSISKGSSTTLPSAYQIDGLGPSGEKVSRCEPSLPMEVPSLAIGDWYFTISGTEADGSIVTSGSGRVIIVGGESTSLAIIMTDVAKPSSLKLSLQGPSSKGSLSEATASLTSLQSNETAIPLATKASTATGDLSRIDAGLYILRVSGVTSDTFKFGAASLISLVGPAAAGLTADFSSASESLMSASFSGKRSDSLALSISGLPATITSGTSITASVNSASSIDGYSLVWFLNGQKQSSRSITLELGANLPLGGYRIDVFAIKADGSDAGSASTFFAIVPAIIASTTITDPMPSSENSGYIGAGIALKDLSASGSLSITTAGTIIENRNIVGTVEVRAANVTIRNCRIYSTGYWPVRVFPSASLTIEYTEIEGTSNAEAAIAASDSTASYVARHLDVHGVVDGLRASTNVTIESCYIHDLLVIAGQTHNDGIQMLAGSDVVIRGNRIDPGSGCNSAIIIQTDFGMIDNVLISGNYLSGGGYTVFSRIGNYSASIAPTNVRILNNSFGKSYVYGLFSIDGSALCSGNTWASDDSSI